MASRDPTGPAHEAKRLPTLRALQTNLPWALGYSEAFETAKINDCHYDHSTFQDQSSMAHLDFTHTLLHIGKATGQLMAMCENADHNRKSAINSDEGGMFHGVTDFPILGCNKFLADLVICAMRLANVRPGGAVDLQKAVIARLESKNNVKLNFYDGA